MDKVLLGGWGHSHLDPSIYIYDFHWETGFRAGALYWRPKNKVEEIFALGQSFSNTPYPYNIFERFSIPPLSRAFEGGFDFYPFLLYKEVVMDTASYQYILDASQPSSELPRWFSPNIAEILEKLRENGILILENYSSHFEQPDVSFSLSQHLQKDIADRQILSACLASMELWQSYLLEVSQTDEKRADRIRTVMIPRLEKAQEAIQDDYAHAVPDIGIYLYECLGDVNSTLFLAQVQDLPIYDWESYVPFYEYKLNKMKGDRNGVSLDHASNTLRRLLEVFVPKFQIRSVDDIMEIRSDKHFLEVRSVLSQEEYSGDTEELLHAATDGILQMKEAQDSFNKIVKWVTLPLDFLPVPAVGTLAQEVAEKVSEQRLKKKYTWQLFFLEARKKYSRDTVRSEIKKKRGKKIG